MGENPPYFVEVNMSVKDDLVKLLNAKNGTAFTADRFVFGAPVAIGGATATARNTSLMLTGIDLKGFKGSKVIRYTRLDLSTVYSQKVNGKKVTSTYTELSATAFVPFLNGLLVLGLTTADVVDEMVSFTATKFYSVKASAKSMKWSGFVEIKVTPYTTNTVKNVIGWLVPTMPVESNYVL